MRIKIVPATKDYSPIGVCRVCPTDNTLSYVDVWFEKVYAKRTFDIAELLALVLNGEVLKEERDDDDNECIIYR